jgi:hypothetical protein
LALIGETNTDASEAEQHVRCCLPGVVGHHAQAEQDCCDCRRGVDVLSLEVLMSPMPIAENRVAWTSQTTPLSLLA